MQTTSSSSSRKDDYQNTDVETLLLYIRTFLSAFSGQSVNMFELMNHRIQWHRSDIALQLFDFIKIRNRDNNEIL